MRGTRSSKRSEFLFTKGNDTARRALVQISKISYPFSMTMMVILSLAVASVRTLAVALAVALTVSLTWSKEKLAPLGGPRTSHLTTSFVHVENSKASLTQSAGSFRLTLLSNASAALLRTRLIHLMAKVLSISFHNHLLVVDGG